jgi:RNA polymerase sigma-70 factor (ECF subfamily)
VSQTQELRGLAFAVAYRMLGSVAEAEDVTQEALLRLHDASGVENPEAFLTTVATRLAIDVLRSARVRRETYTGTWLPEPLVEDDASAGSRTRRRFRSRSSSCSSASTPTSAPCSCCASRSTTSTPTSPRSSASATANARQILSRARRRVADERPRFDPDPGERRALAARFLAAARNGDMEGLVAMLAPDAVMVGDGGGKARSLPGPLHGAAGIARALVQFGRLGERWGATFEPAVVNGQPGFRTMAPDGRLVNVVAIEIEGGVVRRIYSALNPDKLGHLGPLSDLGLRPIGAGSPTG